VVMFQIVVDKDIVFFNVKGVGGPVVVEAV
jgi:hypothetical protein